jgi:class 3 adenylate cyclase
MLGEEEGFVEGMETTMLLSTITKIGGLMCVGFGEAGASIIANNLKSSSGGKLDLMGGGTIIESIFGFCDVRQFTDTTECLQEEVMLFVNRIAHILHSIVVQCSGSANKNIGDAFLLTWKLDEQYTDDQKSCLADQALLAFCKTLVELIRYEEFIVNFTAGATARLYKKFPEYHVRIGSGLHVGWAIEGAIGSNRKIDASYLSPHVNFTEFLESSTKTYGVPLLMSEPYFKLLGPTAKGYCRQVDRVRRSESEDPISLYTYDSDIYINFADMNRKRPSAPSRPANRRGSVVNSRAEVPAASPNPRAGRRSSIALMEMRHNLDHKEAEKKEDEEAAMGKLVPSNDRDKSAPIIVVPLYSPALWDTDHDLVDLRHLISNNMRVRWAQGMDAYVSGDWDRATRVFNEALAETGGKDGPAKFLLSVISDEYRGNSDHWPGYRMEGGGH